MGNDTKHGFLSAAFDLESIYALVESQDVVCGRAGNKVAGYYLVNSLSGDGVLSRHKSIVKDLIENNIVPFESRI